jgi:hypothetical protein
VFILAAAVAISHPLNIDEGIWGYSAWRWVEFAEPPYAFSVENKPPGIFLLYALLHWAGLGGHVAIRLLGCAAIAATAYLIHATMRHLGARPAQAGAAALVAAGFLLWELTDGHLTAHTEVYACVLTVAATCLVARGPAHSPRSTLAAGGLCGAALMFKPTALVDVLAVAALVILMTPAPRRIALEALVHGAAGLMLAVVLCCTPLWLSGVSTLDILAVSVGLLPESSPDLAYRLSRANRLLFNSALVLLYPVLLIALLVPRGRWPRPWVKSWLLGWLLLTAVAAGASGWGWGHQLKQMAPPVGMLAGMVCAMPCRRAEGTGFAGLRLAGACFVLVCVVLPLSPKVFAGLALGATGQLHSHRGVDWIAERTGPDDWVYIRGMDAARVQYACRRRSPTRYFSGMFSGVLHDAAGVQEEVVRDLRRRPPALILIDGVREPEPWLADILGDYAPVSEIEGLEGHRDGQRYHVYARQQPP